MAAGLDSGAAGAVADSGGGSGRGAAAIGAGAGSGSGRGAAATGSGAGGGGTYAGSGSGAGADGGGTYAGWGSGSAASGSAGNGSADAGALSATGRVVGASAGRTGGATAGAITAGGGAAAAIAGVSSGLTIAGAMYGGSISAEYSRVTTPLPHCASIRKLRSGSVKRVAVVTRITGCPRVFWPTLNCRLAVSSPGWSSPTREKASGEARRTSSCSSSLAVAEMIGISATSGWFRPDFTCNGPRPMADAAGLASASARAAERMSLRCFTVRLPYRGRGGGIQAWPAGAGTSLRSLAE